MRSPTLDRAHVLLADDHPQLLEASKTLLGPYFDVVESADDDGTLLSEALRLRPNVIVTDISACQY
jgi:DNA-binding NarL/FixJ family response regulator